MKKMIILLGTILTLAIGATGCGKDNAASTDKPNDAYEWLEEYEKNLTVEEVDEYVNKLIIDKMSEKEEFADKLNHIYAYITSSSISYEMDSETIHYRAYDENGELFDEGIIDKTDIAIKAYNEKFN